MRLIFLSRCDTVTNAVMMQYSRDFKGHLASLFLNENINLGKKYVFDIRRTSKEVYDHARRALYNSGVVDLMSRSGMGERSSPSRSPSRDEQQEDGLDCGSCQQSRALQERLQKLREALLCMLCCEEEIDAAFCPCGHMVCCQTCANQLQVGAGYTHRQNVDTCGGSKLMWLTFYKTYTLSHTSAAVC